MDKIYSRFRIKLPKIKIISHAGRKNGLNKKITINTAIILIIAVLSFVLILQGISPIIDRICQDTAIAKATLISNNMATEVMKNYEYEDLVNIYKDENRKYNYVTIQYYYNK